MSMTKEEKSWIFQDFANSAYSLIVTTALLPVFFKSYIAADLPHHTSTAYWGYANAIATTIIAILAPLLGILADYKGNKKRYFTFFAFLGIISTTSLSLVQKGDWLPLLIIYIITAVGFAGSNVFYDSFLTDVTTTDRMDIISSRGFAYGYIGGVIPFILTVIAISLSSKIGIAVPTITRFAFFATGIWWFTFTIPLLKNVHQKHFVTPREHKMGDSLTELWNTFKKISKNRNLFLFLCAFFFYIDGVNTIISMSTSFAVDIGIGTSTLMGVLILLQIVAFPFALLYGRLAKRYSPKTMIYVGILTYSFVSIYAVFIQTTTQFLILAVLVGSAQGGIQALSRSLFGKLIPKEQSAEYFGIYNIFGRISAIFGPLLIAIVTTITENSRYGVLSIMILFIIGALIFRKVKEPTFD